MHALEAMPLGFLPLVPQIRGATAICTYRVADHEALLLTDISSLGMLRYLHALVLYRARVPSLLVAAEVDEEEDQYLVVFDGEGHHPLNWSIASTEMEQFAAAAASTAEEWLVGNAAEIPRRAQRGEPYDFLVEELELGEDSYRSLKRAGLQTVGDVVTRTEADLRQLPGITQQHVKEIADALANLGVRLRKNVAGTGPTPIEASKTFSDGVEPEDVEPLHEPPLKHVPEHSPSETPSDSLETEDDEPPHEPTLKHVPEDLREKGWRLCYRHADQLTLTSCARCQRPICSDCSYHPNFQELCRACAADWPDHKKDAKEVLGRGVPLDRETRCYDLLPYLDRDGLDAELAAAAQSFLALSASELAGVPEEDHGRVRAAAANAVQSDRTINLLLSARPLLERFISYELDPSSRPPVDVRRYLAPRLGPYLRRKLSANASAEVLGPRIARIIVVYFAKRAGWNHIPTAPDWIHWRWLWSNQAGGVALARPDYEHIIAEGSIQVCERPSDDLWAIWLTTLQLDDILADDVAKEVSHSVLPRSARDPVDDFRQMAEALKIPPRWRLGDLSAGSGWRKRTWLARLCKLYELAGSGLWEAHDPSAAALVCEHCRRAFEFPDDLRFHLAAHAFLEPDRRLAVPALTDKAEAHKTSPDPLMLLPDDPLISLPALLARDVELARRLYVISVDELLKQSSCLPHGNQLISCLKQHQVFTLLDLLGYPRPLEKLTGGGPRRVDALLIACERLLSQSAIDIRGAYARCVRPDCLVE